MVIIFYTTVNKVTFSNQQFNHMINTLPLASFYVFEQCVVQLHQAVVCR